MIIKKKKAPSKYNTSKSNDQPEVTLVNKSEEKEVYKTENFTLPPKQEKPKKEPKKEPKKDDEEEEKKSRT